MNFLSNPRVVQWTKAVWVVCAILLSFMFFAQIIVGTLFQVIAGDQALIWLKQPMIMLCLTAVMYAVAIGIVWLGYRLLRVTGDFVTDTRLRRRPKPRQLLLVLAALGGYIVTTIAVGILARMLFPELPWDQVQEIGYARTESVFELIIIGLALVVAAPVMEEIIFRGVMFSGVKRFLSTQTTTVVVALAFGLAHQQWNVSLDTFILGLFLGYLRAETDSVWPSILLHMLKNFIAYMGLFILWPWTSQWL